MAYSPSGSFKSFFTHSVIMFDYKSNIKEILEKSNGLSISEIDEKLMKLLKREYRFEDFFHALYELEKENTIFRGKGGEYEKGKLYIQKPEH